MWLIVFVVCCGECLGLCLLLLHSRSLSPCVCRVIHAHVSPSPSHVLWCLCVVCVRHVTCTVCVVVGTLQHTALLCSILSALLFLSLSLPPPSPEKTQGCVERREGERSGWRKRKKEEEERSDAKTSGKKGGKKRKRDYDTWCSQVVSNPSTNQAQTGFTSLIRREVVLSSWYGRNSLFLFSLCLSVCG